jgi:hypothetical protein
MDHSLPDVYLVSAWIREILSLQRQGMPQTIIQCAQEGRGERAKLAKQNVTMDGSKFVAPDHGGNLQTSHRELWMGGKKQEVGR